MCFILLWLLLTSYFAFLFQKFYYDVSGRGLFVFILLGFHVASWIYELISFFRFGNMFCHYLGNYYFVVLSLSCLSKAVEHILDLSIFPLCFLGPFYKFSILFDLHVWVWIFSTNLSSSLQNCSSAVSSMRSNTFTSL